MKKTGIIGGGFAGTMTAVHLIEKCTGPFELVVVNEPGTLNKGVAYNPYSQKQLLNVIASKMSAYPEKPDHFVDWISMRAEFAGLEHGLVANAFLPRYLYGEYLTEIWGEALKTAQSKQVQIRMIEDTVVDLEVSNSGILMVLSGGDRIMTDDCILATGNLIPGNPKIKNSSFFESPHYFQNPWEKLAVSNVRNLKSIMLAGNGLTMVDTVIGLLENGFHGTIYSVSPNGYNILPHRHNGLTYSKLREEFPATASLSQIVRLVHKHIKSVRKLGISAEPVIDSIRPLTQQIWRTMTDAEKQLFISRLRHLWGVARHRIPLHIHDNIQKLRIDGKLHVIAGTIVDITETDQSLTVEYLEKKNGIVSKTEADRVINCTGPETDLMKSGSLLLKSCLIKGIITQDRLRLGIRTDIKTYKVIDENDCLQPRLFTLGSNLKGELWESTAVNELRKQASELAEKILFSISAEPGNFMKKEASV